MVNVMVTPGFYVIEAYSVAELKEKLDLFADTYQPTTVRTTMTSLVLEDGKVLHTVIVRYS